MVPERIEGFDRRIGWTAYVLLGAAHLLTVWRYDYFASLDGPVHVYIAAVLDGYEARPALRHYFALNPGPHPNLLIYGLLYGLLQLMSPAAAEKLLVSGYVLGLPLALRFAAGPLTPAPWFAVLLAWPLALALPLFLGLYNLSYGLMLTAVGFGLYLRAAAAPGALRLLALGLAGLVVYFTHIFAALALLAFVAIAAAASAPAARRRGEGVRSRLLWPALALAPASLLALMFVLGNETPPSPLSDGDSLFYRAVLLGTAGFLWSLGARDYLWGMALMALLLLTLYHRLRVRAELPLAADTGLLAVALAFLLLFLVMPLKAGGGGWLLHRLQPFLYLAFALWLGSRPLRPRFRQVISVLLLAFCLGLGLWRLPQLATIDRFRAAAFELLRPLGPGATVTAAVVGPFLDKDGANVRWRNHPLHHLAAYPAAERGAVFVGLYQLHVVYFPLRYRPGLDFFDFRVALPPGGDPDLPRLIDLAAYNAGPQRRLDYVLLLGDVARSDVHALDAFMAQLAAGYRLEGSVERPGPFRLYRLIPPS
jgi:hypothetical protein